MQNKTSHKPYKIISLQAKDIYAAERLAPNSSVTNEGYSIRKQNDDLNYKKFTNALDWSLDTIKLQEEYTKVTRRKNFYFTKNHRQYTLVVINVNFDYSYKLFNKAGKNTFLRDGHSLRDVVIQDGSSVKDGQLVAIQTNVAIQNPLPKETLGEYFDYQNGCYIQTKSFPILMTKADLRYHLYKNGFVCDGIKYVRYKRSSGSSRVGKCLFIDERFATRMTKWSRCGLTIKDGDALDLPAYESYCALPLSSIIDTIDIEPDSILVVDDFTSKFTDEVVAVEAEDDHLVSSRQVREISNSIWDGESLMDGSMFDKYEDKGMLLLRNRFFKTCAFNTNIQQWFADNSITDVSQLNGFTRATDISQIKLITTPSSIKYAKFGTIEQWMDNIDHTFGIVKYEKEPHFFDGRLVQCHYQLLNSLQLTYDEVKQVLEPSLKYIGAVRSDPAVLRYHIKFAFPDEEDEFFPQQGYKTKNDVVFKMLGINDKFAQTKIYKDFRDTLVKGFYRNLKRGHALLNGNYSTLLGNGLELLKASIGQFTGGSELPPRSIHSKRFDYGKTILGTRSPHILAGNVLLAENVANEAIDKYFNMTKEIVYVNSIGENILQQLNGADRALFAKNLVNP